MKSQYSSASKGVDRAIRLLLLFREQQELGVTELATAIGEHKSAVHRTVAPLLRHGFLERTARGRLRLGLAFVELGELALRRIDLRRVVRPLLERLVAQTHETAILSILRGAYSVCIDKVESPNHLRIVYELGSRNPANAGASPRTILAFMPEADVRTILASCEFVAWTRYTPRSMAELLDRLREVKRNGYSISYGELSEGLHSIAVPILDHLGLSVGSVALVGPAQRLTDERIGELLPTMLAISREASGKLGCPRGRPADTVAGEGDRMTLSNR